MTKPGDLPVPVLAVPPALPKVPRTQTVRLRIECELCPQALMVALALLEEHAMTPFTITARQGDGLQYFDFELDQPASLVGRSLLHSLRRVKALRKAEWCAARALDGPLMAKL